MEIKHLAHASYRVSDMDQSIEFYTEGLGLKEIFRIYAEELMEINLRMNHLNSRQERMLLEKMEEHRQETAIVYLEITGHEFIELFAGSKDLEFCRPDQRQNGLLHLALEVDDIKKAREEMIKKGIRVTSEINYGPDNTWQFWLEDPDGNEIELMEYTQDSMQMNGGSGNKQMAAGASGV
ncbi:VOC family protein [Lachnospiraceae bacterium ASD4241]|uniref:VOC family protein n=2 Tax=Diplocloster modestus TaxID=2850322 RepID=A0ABS6KED3_9FIRM|nr:VOC family protein [Diplocloster modestus]